MGEVLQGGGGSRSRRAAIGMNKYREREGKRLRVGCRRGLCSFGLWAGDGWAAKDRQLGAAMGNG